MSITEGSTATFTVKLSTAPTNTVTVTIAEATTGDNTDGEHHRHQPGRQDSDFRDRQHQHKIWSAAQTVTLTAAQDTDLEHGKRDFTLTASGGGYANQSATITATEAEDDKGMHIAPATLTVQETGSATYTVALGAKPSGTVTVAWRRR